MKIYGTLGPACSDADTLYEMFCAGMTGVRLNLSHVTLDMASDQIDALHRAAARAGVQTDLLMDMQGPELRIGVPDAPLTLREGDVIMLTAGVECLDDVHALPEISVPPIVLPALIPGQQLLLDDGKILCEVVDIGIFQTQSLILSPRQSLARVLRGGILHDRKSLALPGAEVTPPTMTDADHANIRLAKQYGVTGLMQPFVRNAADLKAVRAALRDADAADIRLFAKIENRTGVEHIAELLPYADEFVIARGDLGNAMPLWELPAVQKRLAAAVKAAGKDLMIVTQMLASMEHSPVPTRAEVCDIFNAVLDGADSVMVTGETAMGSYPVEVIRYLANTASEAQKYLQMR